MGTDRQLLKSVMERKLRYFGHIMRRPGECLEKTVIQGCIEGSRPRGRPARSWINDILEATNCTLGQSLRLTEDRQAWREMVHSASHHQHWWRIKKKKTVKEWCLWDFFFGGGEEKNKFGVSFPRLPGCRTFPLDIFPRKRTFLPPVSADIGYLPCSQFDSVWTANGKNIKQNSQTTRLFGNSHIRKWVKIVYLKQ